MIVGVAVWLATGTVTLASAGSSAVRLVAPGPFWWLLVGVGLAALVPAWRRFPILASPALLTMLPWLPVPLPALGLIWTGPLAWVPVGFAGLAALGATVEGGPGAAGPVRLARHATAAGVLTLLAGALVLASVHVRLPGGDEPHYLVITQSLLADGDLRIENNHDRRDYAAYWGGNLAPHFAARGRDGEIYSIHAPGVSVLVAPLFALFGLAGAQWTILLLAACTGSAVWLAGWYAARQAGAAWFAWAAVVGSTTLLVQSVMIFPDGPAAAIVATSAVVWLRLSQREPPGTAWLVGLSALLAFLPFLHTRFVVLAMSLGVILAAALWQVAGPEPTRRRLRRLLVFSALPTVGALLWFGYFQMIYGTPNPIAPYAANSESRLANIPGGVAGLLFDQQFGLFAYTPVLALAISGWYARAGGRRLWPLAAVAGVYLAAVGTYWMWWAGMPASPARLATAAVPLCAAPLAVMWREAGRARRALAGALLVASLLISVRVLGVDNGELAWSVRGGYAPWLEALGPVVDLSRAWPSFFWRVVGGDVSSEWPFVVHTLVWCAIATVTVALTRRGATWRGGRVWQSAATAWLLPVALMVAAQAGWWLNGVSGGRPAVSQLAWIRQVAAGTPAAAVSAFIVRPVPPRALPVRVAVPDQATPGSPAAWGDLLGVPAGRYQLHLSARRPTGGTLTVRTSVRDSTPTVFALPRRSRHTIDFDLPVGVTHLHLVPDAELAAGRGDLELVPEAVQIAPFVPARSLVTAGRINAYLLDDDVFREGRGFWVGGGKTAHLVVVAADSAPGTLAITIVNGPRPNAVVLAVDGQVRRLDLASSEVAVVELPVPGLEPVRVDITSPEGFRPSDDRRYLGVRVELAEATAGEPPAPAGPQ